MDKPYDFVIWPLKNMTPVKRVKYNFLRHSDTFYHINRVMVTNSTRNHTGQIDSRNSKGIEIALFDMNREEFKIVIYQISSNAVIRYTFMYKECTTTTQFASVPAYNLMSPYLNINVSFGWLNFSVIDPNDRWHFPFSLDCLVYPGVIIMKQISRYIILKPCVFNNDTECVFLPSDLSSQCKIIVLTGSITTFIGRIIPFRISLINFNARVRIPNWGVWYFGFFHNFLYHLIPS